MSKKGFGLIFAIFILLVLSSLSILIIQLNATSNNQIIKENLYNQAKLHMLSAKELAKKLDYSTTPCINNLKIDDEQFDIKLNFSYYSDKKDCQNLIYKKIYNNQSNVTKVEITVKSRINDFDNIRLKENMMIIN